ncbi:MAG: U32 family peptidase [Firmicutes bacterium]|nr:U32 family peptidase [Bacillota bacterium]
MKKIELLSPAGNMESLYAAIEGGCDAIYLGGYQFGARSFAGNFSLEEMKQAVYLAHLYGVKIYVTVNTMVYEREVERFLHYVDELVSIHVDALIISDIGMFSLIRKCYPNLELHASTQMHLHQLEGVQFAKKIGFQRAVIARETPIDVIKEIKKKTQFPLEVFCHGALCMSYSGQCLLSHFIGGRSGNRGTCSQCCRLPYELYNESYEKKADGYLLSTKDLNSLEWIGELIDAGVDSLKIEGRMKRPEYVYYVTKLYRMAIDSYQKHGKVLVTENDIYELKKIFHRQFTKGFLFGEQKESFTNPYRPNHMGVEIGKVVKVQGNRIQVLLKDSVAIHDGLRIVDKKDIGVVLNQFYLGSQLVKEAHSGDIITFQVKTKVSPNAIVLKTTDEKQRTQIQDEIQKKARKVLLKGTLICHYQEPLKLQVTDKDSVYEFQTEQVLEVPKKKPVSKEQLKEKLNRFHETVYEFESLEIVGDEGFIPISAVNELRRNMVAGINFERTKREEMRKQDYQVEPITVNSYQAQHAILIHTLEQYQDISADVIYVEDEELYQKIKDDKRVVFRLSNIMNQYQNDNRPVLIGECGSILKYQNFITDSTFNVANSYAVYFLMQLGAKRVTLSLECDEEDIIELYHAYQRRYHTIPRLEVVTSHIPVVMTLKYPLLKRYHINQSGYLKDRLGKYMPVIEKNNITRIYFYQRIELSLSKIEGITQRIELDLEVHANRKKK